MTEPSQYFKGRTVQEQMNEVIGYVDVRSAEVATDAIAADVAQVHQDMLDADADATAAAASAAAAAGVLANAVKKTGEVSQSIDGDINLNDDLNVDGDATVGGALAVTGAVTVPTPVNNTDAATKKYVDDALDNYAPMVRTTDNQTIGGVKAFTQHISKVMSANVDEAHADDFENVLQIFDSHNNLLGYIYFKLISNNQTQWIIGTRNVDGTYKEDALITGDP